MTGGLAGHLHMTTSLRTAPTHPPLFLVSPLFPGVNQEFGSLIFSIFLESFDHWLPGLTNESVDRVTCVAPPAPTLPPPGRAGENLHNSGLRETRLETEPVRRADGPGRCRGGSSPTVQSASLFLSVSLVLGSGYREFCGAGGDRLGLRQTDQSGSRLLGVRTHSVVTQSHSLSVSQSQQQQTTESVTKWSQGLPGCDMLWLVTTSALSGCLTLRCLTRLQRTSGATRRKRNLQVQTGQTVAGRVSLSLCLPSVITVYCTVLWAVQMCLKPRGLTLLAN